MTTWPRFVGLLVAIVPTCLWGADTAPEAPRFSRHVVPLFSKLGCNAGACHGAVQGQNGFRLSLFGLDPATDYERLLRDATGRRIDPLDPDASLLLLKSLGQPSHRGGKRTDRASPEYRVLRDWLAAGAPLDDVAQSVVQSLSVAPPERLGQPGEQFALSVAATFADGSREDVTAFCTFESNNKDVAEVDREGRVMLTGVGDAAIVVRFRSQPVMATVLVPQARPLATPVAVPETHFIDRHVFAKLRRLQVEPSDLCDDATFLRRVRLDVTGSLPTADEVRAFLADADPQKRKKKIESLLGEPGYSALWATKFCDVLKSRISYEDFTHQPATAAIRDFYAWVRRRLDENVPYDQFVSRMLLATSLDGRSREAWIQETIDRIQSRSPRPGEVETATQPDRSSLDLFWHRFDSVGVKGAVQFAHAFLGLRLQCAQCHRHPSDVWSQDDVLSLANFFQRTRANTGVMSVKEAGEFKKAAGSGLTDDERKRLTDEAKRLADEAKKLQDEAKTKKDDKAAAEELQAAARRLTEQSGAITRAVKVLDVSYVGPIAGMPFGWATVTSPLGTQKSQTFRLLGERDAVTLADDEDPRERLVAWLLRADNPFFARALVNRVWAYYFGRGIVDPPDDLSPLNPPSHPELLAELSRRFVEQRYDLKWLHRTILTSAAYQRSARTKPTNAGDRRNFATFQPRRLSAELLVDALGQVTGVPDQFKRGPTMTATRALELPGTNADKLIDNPSIELAFTVFGRPTRNAESLCDCERETRPALVQSLYLANHPDVLKKIASPKGRVAELVKGEADDARRIEELYLVTLARLPTDAERQTSLDFVRASSTPTRAYEGLLWALLNTREFVLVH